MTLEDYLLYEFAKGKIDFSMRVSAYAGYPTEFYIHPTGKDGTTTPTLIVEGNTVRIKPGSFSPDWSE